MTEDDAKGWIADRWGADRLALLTTYVGLLISESERQNLIARSTIDTIWARHIVDSAQLVEHAAAKAKAAGDWLDIGTGAGLPGIVAAILQSRRVTMVEPRRGRVAFLEQCVSQLALGADVIRSPVERFEPDMPFAVISARAVASIDMLFDAANHLANRKSLWLLPRGKSHQEELAAAQTRWRGMFHVEQSITAPDSGVVIASGVARK